MSTQQGNAALLGGQVRTSAGTNGSPARAAFTRARAVAIDPWGLAQGGIGDEREKGDLRLSPEKPKNHQLIHEVPSCPFHNPAR